MTKIRALLSTVHDPWFNLATEDWIFREMDPSSQTLFLWQNFDSVVIGRNQNPWSECKLDVMARDGVRLARRSSGGGAVFHDLGNLCFTFLSPKSTYDRVSNARVVLSALQAFGVRAEVSGRNDLIVQTVGGPRKISGSAFRETRDRAFHHGTLLVSSNLDRLADYLTPHPKKMQSKGRASVRSRVMNLSEGRSEINCESLKDALFKAFFARHGATCQIESLDYGALAAVPHIRETLQRFSSWDWRFGHAPQFQQQMSEYLSWGLVELHLDSDHGRIERAKLFSDALDADLVSAIERGLTGRTFSRDGVREAAAATLRVYPERANEIAEFDSWLATQAEV